MPLYVFEQRRSKAAAVGYRLEHHRPTTCRFPGYEKSTSACVHTRVASDALQIVT